MDNWKNIQLNIGHKRADLVLNTPRKQNALNPEMIEEMHMALKAVSEMDEVQFVILSGEGKSFCVGADINWFAAAADKAKADNWQEFFNKKLSITLTMMSFLLKNSCLRHGILRFSYLVTEKDTSSIFLNANVALSAGTKS